MEKPIVLITGASQGIGRAAAITMARAGYHIIAVARRQEKLEELDDEIKKNGGDSITIVPLDLKDGAGIDRLGGAIFERYKKLDGLIHCGATLGDLTPITHVSPREAQNIIDINLIATYRIIYSLGPLLTQSSNGRAIFFSSTVAADPRANWGMYGASKAGMEAIVKSWAQENTLNNIVATILNPGGVATGMRRKAFPGEDFTKLPQPSDLGTMILELMSPNRDKSLNGAVINFRDTEHFKALNL
jgi:NAD(P)-dependent dehydrogenase (short-subunit alcohol dehydrogenase family)